MVPYIAVTVYMKTESAVRKALITFSLLPEDGNVAIALSGGKDSLTLLHMLKKISGRGFPPLNLTAIHVNGEFSCGAGVDLPYLEKICQDLEVPLLVRESTLSRDKLSCYPCSRIRRTLIFDAAKSVGATTVAFGHHRDDNAQTVLLNLFHKGEFAGNLPKLHMVDYGITIIRPLILLSEAEIRSFAQKEGFARITCQCPVGARSMRKKVEELLGELEQLFPHVRENISRAGLIYGSDKAKTP
jgi:tRNA 2-thiocytidine biosynthesis protein TtcA